MKIVSGICRIEDIIKIYNSKFKNEFEDIEINANNRVTEEFIKTVTKRPIIFYAKKRAFSQSFVDVDFEKYKKDIIFCENIELLKFLAESNIGDIDINFIIIQLSENSNNIKLSSFFEKIVLFDFWKYNKKTEKIDFSLFSDILENYLDDAIIKKDKFVKHFKTKFLENILNVKLYDYRYIYNKRVNILNFKDIATKFAQKKLEDDVIYSYKCPYCDTETKIIADTSELKNDEYVTISDFLTFDDNDVKLKCCNFVLDKDKIGKSKEEAFLYIFYCIRKINDKDDEKIEFFIKKTNKKAIITVDKMKEKVNKRNEKNRN